MEPSRFKNVRLGVGSNVQVGFIETGISDVVGGRLKIGEQSQSSIQLMSNDL